MSSDFVLRDEMGDASLVSNNRGCSDFVMPYVSPVSQRRALRASKELNAQEVAEINSIMSPKSKAPAPLDKQNSWRATCEMGAAIDPMVGVKDEPTSPTGVLDAFFSDNIPSAVQNSPVLVPTKAGN